MIDHTDGQPHHGTGLVIERTTRYVRMDSGEDYAAPFVQIWEIDHDDLEDTEDGDPVTVALSWLPEAMRDYPASGSRMMSTVRLIGAWSAEQQATFASRQTQ